MPNGTVMLYNATADTFIASRKDFTSLAGAYAASNYGNFIVDNHLLNASLVPMGDLSTTSGASSGFAFVDQMGFRTTSSGPQTPGAIQRVDLQLAGAVLPTGIAEAPLVGVAGEVFTSTLALL